MSDPLKTTTPEPTVDQLVMQSAYNAVDDRKMDPKAPKFYMAGVDDRPTDLRVVAVAVRFRCELKVGDRDFSAPLCLHEIAVMRRFYEMRGGGNIRVVSGWLPGLTRFVPLTHDKLKREMERMARTFVVPRAGQPPIMCFADYFGQSPSEQLVRVHTVMRQQFDGWLALVKRAEGRMVRPHEDPKVNDSLVQDLITEKEMDELVNLADPSRRGLDEIELDQVVFPTEATAAVATGDDRVAVAKAMAEADEKADPLDATMDRLKVAGANERQALETASLLEIAGSVDKISDEDLARIAGGKGRAAAFRKALLG